MSCMCEIAVTGATMNPTIVDARIDVLLEPGSPLRGRVAHSHHSARLEHEASGLPAGE